jgi:hypothetical protein
MTAGLHTQGRAGIQLQHELVTHEPGNGGGRESGCLCMSDIPGSSRNSPVCHQVAEKYPFVTKYRNAWPVRMLMQQYMANHRANLRAKRAASKATPADTGRGSVGPANLDLNDTEGNGDEHEDESDVIVSDLDDD